MCTGWGWRKKGGGDFWFQWREAERFDVAELAQRKCSHPVDQLAAPHHKHVTDAGHQQTQQNPQPACIISEDIIFLINLLHILIDFDSPVSLYKHKQD